MSARLLTCALLSINLLAACDDGGKGAEDDPLLDGKLDSFFSPTEHGALVFGAPNQASVTSGERFHAWNFTLTGAAAVSLRTEVTSLDTVMYLYRREVGSTSWGHFLLKNDDHGDEIFSQIDLAADAGEYRIVVKGFKTSVRGPFAVIGSCDGAGCPSPSTCVADDFAPQPAPSNFSAACARDLVATLAAPIVSHNQADADQAKICDLGPLKAEVDRFRAYWDDVQGWDDFTGGEEVAFTVDNDLRASGRTSLVDTDIFDEDAITFFYDGADQLIGLYQHNQSPDVRWFCGAGQAAVDEPSCLDDMIVAMPHRAADIKQQTTASASCANPAGLPELAALAICDFTSSHGLAADASVAASIITWDAGGPLSGQVGFSTGAAQATYYLTAASATSAQILAIREGDTTTTPCRTLSR